jgi:hypothetical protein
MADDVAVIIERLAKAIDPECKSMKRSLRDAWLEILSAWENDIQQRSYDEGHDDGKADAEEEHQDDLIVDDCTMSDLETGIDLMKKGDPCAPTYLDRALRDLGSSYY